MSVALFLSGGAPNLTFMAGGLYELETLGVEYSLVSTSGAGMLIGLLYAAPAGEGTTREQRLKALKSTIDMYVDDRIFKMMERLWFFPANYKVFHKSGPLAEIYTRFWGSIPKPNIMPTASSQRLFSDWIDLMLAMGCPTDLGPWSKGMCQPAPFIHNMVDCAKLKDFAADFVMNAYCLEEQKMALFEKNQITDQHFQAALAFPLIYAPFKLDGKTYIEGSAIDTICFEPVFDYLFQPDESAGHTDSWTGRKVPAKYQVRADRPKVDTLLVFNMMGHKQLIREPRQLLDAFAQEIITPLVPLSNDDIRIFRREHLPRYQKANPDLAMLEVKIDLDEAEWAASLDWSRSNGESLFEQGREAARKLYHAHEKRFQPKAKGGETIAMSTSAGKSTKARSGKATAAEGVDKDAA